MVLGTWFGAYGGIAYGPWQGVLLGIARRRRRRPAPRHRHRQLRRRPHHLRRGHQPPRRRRHRVPHHRSSWDGARPRSRPPSPTTSTKVDLLPFLEGAAARRSSGQNRFFLSDLADADRWRSPPTCRCWSCSASPLFPLTWYVLWRTPFGLRLRSVGEDPEAADSLGVKVYRMKYLAVIVSGALAGLGGVMLVYLFAGKFQSGQTSGRGFIGLAAMIFGNWRPGGLRRRRRAVRLHGLHAVARSTRPATPCSSWSRPAVRGRWPCLRRCCKRWVSAARRSPCSPPAAGCWYQATDELPREIIPYFPHVTTLLVLVFAAQRLRHARGRRPDLPAERPVTAAAARARLGRAAGRGPARWPTRAYAPYSRRAGRAPPRWSTTAASSPGCNVENASYGLSLCAECGVASGAGRVRAAAGWSPSPWSAATAPTWPRAGAAARSSSSSAGPSC